MCRPRLWMTRVGVQRPDRIPAHTLTRMARPSIMQTPYFTQAVPCSNGEGHRPRSYENRRTPLDAVKRGGTRSIVRDTVTSAIRRARTPGGRNADHARRSMKKRQVSGYSDGTAETACKTVGSAYVGSNPTPATTSGNGP
jgi:hypothetical protein